MTVAELWKRYEYNEDEDKDYRYDDEQQTADVAELDLQTLIQACLKAQGCGCCVDGAPLTLRGALFAELGRRFKDDPPQV